jgi:putative ABC transport system substrate-binding protein
MRRRDFLGVVSGAAVALPLAARAQQSERVRHIGMLNALGSDDLEAQARIAVFEQALQQLGRVVGRNLKIDIRQLGSDADRLRGNVAEMIALAPDVIFTIGSVAVAPLQQATRTIPIVFINAPDPVGAGFVQSMAQPGGISPASRISSTA